jgi:hypothetical protein
LERGGEKIDDALDDIGAEARKLGNEIDDAIDDSR